MLQSAAVSAVAGGWQLHLPLKPVVVVSSDLMSIGPVRSRGVTVQRPERSGFSAAAEITHNNEQPRPFFAVSFSDGCSRPMELVLVSVPDLEINPAAGIH